MTPGERLFFLILTLQILAANPVFLEESLIPRINCNDLNRNNKPDFIATSNSVLPRSIYHLEYSELGIETLWEFTLPPENSGYFLDFIFSDFDNDGQYELIATAWQEDSPDIFYVFSADVIGFYPSSPLITGLERAPKDINQPGNLYPIFWDNDGDPEFILTQGSPNRMVVVCNYEDGNIKVLESVGEKFLNETFGPLKISVGDFNGDEFDDIFILNNGPNPSGHFIFSDGSEAGLELNAYPRLQHLHKKGVDLNFDGVDDLAMVNKDGSLMSDIWGTTSVPLAESGIEKMLLKPDNGILNLLAVSKSGDIGEFSIDPLSQEILFSEFTRPKFSNVVLKDVYSLFLNNGIILVHIGDPAELWFQPLKMEQFSDEFPSELIQRIYARQPDYFINHGDLFEHPIRSDSAHSFLTFTGELLPDELKFDLEKMKLTWSPDSDQLGFHELYYRLGLRKKGSLKLITEDGKKVITQEESIIETRQRRLIYVNDQPSFEAVENQLTLVRYEEFEWIIPIMDMNADAQLELTILRGESGAEFTLIESAMLKLPMPMDSILAAPILDSPDTSAVDTLSELNFVNGNTDVAMADTSLSDLNEFVEEELSSNTEDEAEVPADAIAVKEFTENTSLTFIEAVTREVVVHQSMFSWTPELPPGNYPFTLLADDGYSTDTLDINIKIHPEINLSGNDTNFAITVGENFAAAINFEQQPKSESHSFSLINAPENMRIDKNGKINWVPLPTQVDDHIFAVDVSDGVAASSLKFAGYVNAPPVISSRPAEIFILPEGKKLEFQFENFDANFDSRLSWKLLSGPDEMTLSEQGILKWKGDNLGHNNYEIQLSDGIDSIRWPADIYVNSRPVILSEPKTLVVAGNDYQYEIIYSDENKISPADSLSENQIELILIKGPEGMVLENKLLHWKTNEKIAGEFAIEISAGDGAGEVIQAFTLFVNSLPVLTSADSAAVQIGDTLNYQIHAEDANPGDSLWYEMEPLLPGMNLAQSSGRLSWVPTKTQLGLHFLNLKILDGHGDIGITIPFHLLALELPKLTSSLPSEAFAGLEYKVFLTAEDMYGNKLDGPESIQIESATFSGYELSDYSKQFKWTPRESDKGDHELLIKLSDQNGIATVLHHKIRVLTNPCIHCDEDE